MEEKLQGATRRRGRVDQGIHPTAGSQHQRAVSGRKGLCRRAVHGDDADLHPLDFDCDNLLLAAIDKAESQALAGTRGNIG